MKKIIFLLIGLVCCDIVAAQETFTLQQLKDSALQHNIAMRSARYGLDAARQQRKETLTKYFPNVSATGLWFNANTGMAKMDMNASDYISPELGATLAGALPPQALAAMANPMTVSMMKNGTIASVMAVQPVFAGGQIVNGNKLARLGEDVSRLQMELSENEVEKTVEEYYWQLVTLQEKMKTVEAVDTLLADIYKDVDVAVRAGVALRNDLLQVQLRQNDVESQKLKLENGLQIVSLMLSQYCGLSKSEELRVKSEEYLYRVPSSEGIAVANSCVPSVASDQRSSASLFTLHSSLNNLPEYQLLEKQVEAAKLQKRMEVGKNLPSVAVGAGYNYHNLLENDHSFAMIFATVSVPLSDWWRGSHAIKRRKIEQQRAEDQLRDNSELLQIRARKAWNDVQEAFQQLLLAGRGMEQASENLRLNRDFYKAGTSTMSDLLQAQLLYQQACDKQVDAYANYQNKLLAYRQSIGE